MIVRGKRMIVTTVLRDYGLAERIEAPTDSQRAHILRGSVT